MPTSENNFYMNGTWYRYKIYTLYIYKGIGINVLLYYIIVNIIIRCI